MANKRFIGRTLITGGTGTFGTAFIKHLLGYYDILEIIAYSRDEYKQYKLSNELKDKRVRFIIGDIRDKERLKFAMNGVNTVVHAAALKHVPVCEYNPTEAINTNILGGQNVIDAALHNNVDHVIALSTDKAVNPINLYGSTKLCAERLFINSNIIHNYKTTFSIIRYGNVIGSRGSVIHKFIEDAKDGTIKVTHPDMTRFLITIERAVKCVMDCWGKIGVGGIYIPKIPAMGIVDIARIIGPVANIEYTGIRPGEKLHERLLSQDEILKSVVFNDYIVCESSGNLMNLGISLDENFSYDSKTNPYSLPSNELQELINGYLQG
jgi:UDP-N-acetylglucosamine 4,6-dehydratase